MEGNLVFGFPIGNVGGLRFSIGQEVPKPPGPRPFRYCPEGQAWRNAYAETADALADEHGAWGFVVVFPDGRVRLGRVTDAHSDPSAMYLLLADEVQP